jgi:putative hydrolase of the HAD superfamily
MRQGPPIPDRVTHVFFDFAGTLVEGVPHWEWPQVAAGAEVGCVVTPEQVKDAIWRVWGPLEGCAHPEASADEATYARWIGAIERQILAGLGLPEAQLDRATARVMALQVAAASYRVYPEVRPTLAALRDRGYRLGLISNFAWQLPALVADLGLADAFDLVLTSARAGYRKPRPEIFQQALATTGASADRALYVGDDPVCDVAGARGAGLAARLVDRRSAASGEALRSLAELVH